MSQKNSIATLHKKYSERLNAHYALRQKIREIEKPSEQSLKEAHEALFQKWNEIKKETHSINLGDVTGELILSPFYNLYNMPHVYIKFTRELDDRFSDKKEEFTFRIEDVRHIATWLNSIADRVQDKETET